MTRPGPGKYEGNETLEVCEALYELLGISGQISDFGDVTEAGHFVALLEGDGKTLPKAYYITDEDSYGFFTYYEFDSMEEALKEFDSLYRLYHAAV